MRGQKRCVISAAGALLLCQICGMIPGFEMTGRFEHSVLFLLYFLNINELLKEGEDERTNFR